jgi:hypothetical protein
LPGKKMIIISGVFHWAFKLSKSTRKSLEGELSSKWFFGWHDTTIHSKVFSSWLCCSKLLSSVWWCKRVYRKKISTECALLQWSISHTVFLSSHKCREVLRILPTTSLSEVRVFNWIPIQSVRQRYRWNRIERKILSVRQTRIFRTFSLEFPSLRRENRPTSAVVSVMHITSCCEQQKI